MNSNQRSRTKRKTVFSFVGNNSYTIASDGAETTVGTGTTYTTSILVTCTCPTGLK